MDRARVAERQQCGRNFTGMSLDRNRPSSREFVRSTHPLASPKTYAGSEYSDTQAVPDAPDALIDRLRVGFLRRKNTM